MGRWSPLAVWLLLFVISPAFGQGNPPRCDDELCRSIRTIIAVAPTGFQSWRGKNISASDSPDTHLWESTYAPPGFADCHIHSHSPFVFFDFMCGRAESSFASKPEANAFYKRVQLAFYDAAPSWCAHENGTYVGFYPPGTCPSGMELANFSVYYGVSFNFSSAITESLVRQATAVGVLVVRGAPAGARVTLNREDRGVTDTQGNLTLMNIRPGKHTLTIEALARKPFSQEVTVAGDDSQTVVARLEATPLSEAEVERGLKEGISPARMKTLVAEVGVDFPLTDDSEQRLRAAGADDALIIAIAKNKK